MTNENKEVIYHRWIKIHADFLVLVLIGIWNIIICYFFAVNSYIMVSYTVEATSVADQPEEFRVKGRRLKSPLRFYPVAAVFPKPVRGQII